MTKKFIPNPELDPEFEKHAASVAERFISDRPDLCSRILEKEMADDALGQELADEIRAFITEGAFAENDVQKVAIQRKIRRVIREQAGLWVNLRSKF